jgi:Zn-dependent peptidase ImmA (M78 family)/DNA-binding XRE family transcriptional regulator
VELGFNATRLDLARRRRGLTKGRLAEAAGLSTRILAAYERGDREPSEATVQKLAAALRFPAAFFTGEEIEEPSVDGVSFRALSTMTARQRDQATGAACIALQLDDWIRERFELPSPDVPRLGDVDPEAAAEAVRQMWNMGQGKAPNMVHLLEAHGARVFSLVQECVEVDAFSFWRHGAPYIFLNNQKSAERSRMDAAHELGHLVMHSHGGPTGRAAEDEAQAFGSAFLMPRRSVLAGVAKGATVPQMLNAKRRWNVAAMNLAHRMHKLGLLSEWQARSTYIQLGRMGYRDGEPVGIDRETSQIMPKAFAVLRREGIARAQVAKELCVPVEELNVATFGPVLARGTEEEHAEPAGFSPLSPGRRPDLRIVI